MIPKAQLEKADETLPITLFDSPKLAQQKLIQKLSDVMDERYKKFLLYGALEGQTLVFYFSHNAIASEFISKIEEFRENIIPLYKKFNMKSTLFFKNIQAKTKHKPIERKETKEPYRDRAFGTFNIEVKDPSIAAVFNKLKETIRRSHETEEDDPQTT